MPKSYLRFFAQEKNQDKYQIYVFDKQLNKEFICNINDIAEKYNYNRIDKKDYIIPTPDGNPLYYEEKYRTVIEGQIPRIIRNISSMCTLNPNKYKFSILDEFIKYDLAKMIIVQLLRTPQSRKQTYTLGKSIHDEMTEHFKKCTNYIPNSNKKKQIKKFLDNFKYSESFSDSVHLKTTMDDEKIEKYIESLIQNHIWIMYENHNYPYLQFVTSDHPVIMFNFSSRKLGLGNNALENPNTIISMPLSPKFEVTLYHKSLYFLECIADGCFPITKRDYMFQQNKLQYLHCDRQIYTRPDSRNLLVDLQLFS